MASPRAGKVANLVTTLYVEGSLTGMTDEQLLERFVSSAGADAEQMFSALVQRHGPMVLSVCRSALRDHHAAEDAFQATFLVLARKAPSLRTPGRLGPWLHGVARRTARKLSARKSRFDRLIERAHTKARLAGFVEPAIDIDRHEETQMLHEEIGRLPDRYRSAVVLCYLEGMTHEEAAGRLGWPVGTVGVRLMRARERLRERLSRRGIEPDTTVLPVLASSGKPLTISLTTRTTRAALSFALSHGSPTIAIRPQISAAALAVLRNMAIKKFAGAIVMALMCGLLAAGSVMELQPPTTTRKPAPAPAPSKVVPRAERAQSILANGGFEAGDAKKSSPDGWQQGAKIAGVEYRWDRDVAHEGRASLHLRKTAQRYFPIAQWFQEVDRKGNVPRLKVSAFVKAKTTTKAILDAQFVGQDGAESHHWAAYIGVKEAGQPPTTHDWKRYQGIVEIPPGTKTMIVAVQIYGPGDVWVDDITAEYTEERATDPLSSEGS